MSIDQTRDILRKIIDLVFADCKHCIGTQYFDYNYLNAELTTFKAIKVSLKTNIYNFVLITKVYNVC